VRADVGERAHDLLAHDRGRNEMNSADAGRILRRDRRDRGHGIGAERRRRLNVALNARAAARIRPRDREQSDWRQAATSWIALTTSLTTARSNDSSSPSAMMRMTGSVPHLRTSRRPEPLRRASPSLMQAVTRALLSGEPFWKRTFSMTCGIGSKRWATSLAG